MAKTSDRLKVLKTYKLYIGGKFPRTESGRYYSPESGGKKLANICRGTRKDFRNAVVAARGAFGGWSGRAAFNRSQILYRIAEMLEGRRAQFVEELTMMGSTRVKAETEVDQSIEILVHYSGWCDKFQQVFSSVNPVASSHFNFSAYEPQGVVAVAAPEDSGLVGLVGVIAPVIAGGNTCIVLASESKPLCSITFAEVLNSSDVPGGVVNIITGFEDEIIEHFASHMDVNAMIYCRDNKDRYKELQLEGAENVKRVHDYSHVDWNTDQAMSPYFILDHQEVKTTWHPIEAIGGASPAY